jgi:hypothetical protein
MVSALRPAAADELLLRNGDRITGRLVSLTPVVCIYETAYAATLRIPPSEIKGLTTAARQTIQLDGGDRVVGMITGMAGGMLSVRSSRFGQLSIGLRELVGVSPDQTASGADTPSSTAADDASNKTPPGRSNTPEQKSVSFDSPRLRGTGIGSAAVTGAHAPQEAQADETTPTGRPPAGQPESPPVTKPVGEEQRQDEERERVFLRQQTVLLRPGQFELDTSVQYTRTQNQGDPTAQITSRQITFIPTMRAGLLSGLEGFIDLPFGWSQREINLRVPNLRTLDQDNFGLADMSFGLKYLLVSESDRWPDLIASLTATAPTGEAQNPLSIFPVRLGGGRWLVGGGLNFVRSYDPAVLFGGIAYTSAFDGTVSGLTVSGGDTFSYSLGLGFALNDQLTVSGQFTGAYSDRIKLQGTTLNVEREPLALRSALTYRFATGEYIEPSITYALNRDAPDAILGLSFIRKF